MYSSSQIGNQIFPKFGEDKKVEEKIRPRKQPFYFLVNRDPYNGLL